MTENIENFQFNTAIARNMEFLNQINEYIREEKNINGEILASSVEILIKLLAPLAPHFAEEQWQKLGKEQSIHNEIWPQVNEEELKLENKTIPIQVNGKLKTCISVDANASTNEILEIIKSEPIIQELFNEYDVKKEIYVPGKIYNLVIGKEKK